jgi:DNA polymerase-3 subunit delta'
VIDLPGQPEAERLLRIALTAPSHAYLLHGPRGAGKDEAANAFVAGLLHATERRIADESHPDLYVVEPEGEAILIDQIRALRNDLHLRPFEAERRSYVIREAETMGRDAANALLKSLEEPPAYAVFVLVCNDRARLLPTIESRCQVVRFRTPSPAAIATALGGDAEAVACARLAHGNLDLARRMHATPAVRERLERFAELAIAAADDPSFDAAAGAAEIVGYARAAGDEAEAVVVAQRDAALARLPEGRQLSRERARVERSFDALAKRRRRRAETDELRAAVDAAIGVWRDVLCVAVGASAAVISSDRLSSLAPIAERAGQVGAEGVLQAARDVRRSLELPVIPSLAAERLFHEIGLRVQVKQV